MHAEHFYEKECNLFCPGKNSNTCQCGLLKEKHEKEVLEKSHGSQWDSATSTKKTKWRCAGTVQFENQNRTDRGPSPYMRIADDVDVDTLVKHIRASWNVPEPSLIVSVTGGAADAELKKEVGQRLSNFQTDLFQTEHFTELNSKTHVS